MLADRADSSVHFVDLTLTPGGNQYPDYAAGINFADNRPPGNRIAPRHEVPTAGRASGRGPQTPRVRYRPCHVRIPAAAVFRRRFARAARGPRSTDNGEPVLATGSPRVVSSKTCSTPTPCSTRITSANSCSPPTVAISPTTVSNPSASRRSSNPDENRRSHGCPSVTEPSQFVSQIHAAAENATQPELENRVVRIPFVLPIHGDRNKERIITVEDVTSSRVELERKCRQPVPVRHPPDAEIENMVELHGDRCRHHFDTASRGGCHLVAR